MATSHVHVFLLGRTCNCEWCKELCVVGGALRFIFCMLVCWCGVNCAAAGFAYLACNYAPRIWCDLALGPQVRATCSEVGCCFYLIVQRPLRRCSFAFDKRSLYGQFVYIMLRAVRRTVDSQVALPWARIGVVSFFSSVGHPGTNEQIARGGFVHSHGG